MKKWMIAIALMVAVLGAMANDVDELYTRANAAYEAGDFTTARDLYLQIEETHTSLELQYNMGNTYYKLGDVAHAILHYERALDINPRDEDARTNLRIANQLVKDKIDALPSLGVDDVVDNLVSANTISMWTWSAIAAMFLSALLAALYLLSRPGAARRMALAGSALLLLTAIIAYIGGDAATDRLKDQSEAIVMPAKVDVLNQPNGDQTVFVLHEGTKVYLRREQEAWVEITIANGSVGWVKRGDIEGV
ncbi:MAG: tetratricopeptide repeat protein [Flavobacteriales bacterium]|nr:tetratricopeptide repeat protein [Flavobacteriales bacterium]